MSYYSTTYLAKPSKFAARKPIKAKYAENERPFDMSSLRETLQSLAEAPRYVPASPDRSRPGQSRYSDYSDGLILLNLATNSDVLPSNERSPTGPSCTQLPTISRRTARLLLLTLLVLLLLIRIILLLQVLLRLSIIIDTTATATSTATTCY